MKELIKKCLYYKGEEDCPTDMYLAGKSNLWEYERKWVTEGGTYADLRGEYAAAGLTDFEQEDGTPISLKFMLFNRYSHWNGDYMQTAETFKKWYKEVYRAAL